MRPTSAPGAAHPEHRRLGSLPPPSAAARGGGRAVTASSTLPRLDGAEVRAGEPQVHVVPLETVGAPGGGVDLPLEPYITVLIPAHDEGDQIAATLEGLRRQSLR